MAAYIFYSIDSSTGAVVDELPMRNVSYSAVLTGVGDFHGDMDFEEPKALDLVANAALREIGVLRNNTVIWNGPVTATREDLQSGTVSVTAQDPMWYVNHWTVETDTSYTAADVFVIVRDLITTAMTKTGANLYNFTVTAGSAGVLKTWAFAGSPRHIVGQIIDQLAHDRSTAFDYRMSYGGSTFSSVNRLLTLGSPSIGSTVVDYVLESLDDGGLTNFVREQDMDRAANRVHAIGSSGQVVTAANATSLGVGVRLVEKVVNRVDVSSSGVLTAAAQEERRLSVPPVRTYSATFRPTLALPQNFAGLGDKISVNVRRGSLQLALDNLRVMKIETFVDDEGEESVQLTFNRPLDETGA